MQLISTFPPNSKEIKGYVFHYFELIENYIDISLFFIWFFDFSLTYLTLMLKRCYETNLMLN